MNLYADMMCDKTHDAFACRCAHRLACVRQTFGKPVDPQTPVRVQHHFNDGWVFQKTCNGGPSAVRNMRAPRATASGLW